MRFTAVARTLVFVLVAFLAACSNGNGGANPPTTVVSLHSLTFSAASPDDATPLAQSFNATFTGDTVFISVLSSGPAVGSVTFTRSGNTAQVTVTPAAPSSVGAGVFSGVVTVQAYTCGNSDCSEQIKGNTETITVAYSIPPIVRVVAPYVGITNVGGDVVIRGRGFKQFPVQDVTFGSTSASAFTIASDTEIDATYPALTAGSYVVQITAPTSPGTILSTANLVVVDPPAIAPTTIAYPSTPVQVGRLIYDAERSALLIAQPGSSGEILRYSFSGAAWTTSSVTDLADIAFTTDGRQLLALSQSAMTHLDPTTLAINVTTTAPTLTSPIVFKNLVIPNDDNAVITTGRSDNHASALYTYPVRTPAFNVSTTNLVDATPGLSANGALAVMAQGDPTQSGSAAVDQYKASVGTFSATGIGLNQNSIPPALDRAATRVVLNGRNVYDGSYRLLGTLPSTTLAVVVKPDASRAYTFETGPVVRSFDLVTTNGGALTEIGSPTVVSSPGTGVAMAISPDGGTLFLAGTDQVVVLTTPP